MTDNVNNPSHYQGRYGMESIDALRNFMTPEQLKGFYLGNALKYQLRFQKKNGLEDLKKARKNLDWLIEEFEVERKGKKSRRHYFLHDQFLTRFQLWKEVKVELGVEAKIGRSYPEMVIHLDISGYGNRVHSVHRFPGVFLTVGESIQLKILFYKRVRNLTADRFLTFRESDWKFLISDLVNEFVH